MEHVKNANDKIKMFWQPIFISYHPKIWMTHTEYRNFSLPFTKICVNQNMGWVSCLRVIYCSQIRPNLHFLQGHISKKWKSRIKS